MSELNTTFFSPKEKKVHVHDIGKRIRIINTLSHAAAAFPVHIEQQQPKNLLQCCHRFC